MRHPLQRLRIDRECACAAVTLCTTTTLPNTGTRQVAHRFFLGRHIQASSSRSEHSQVPGKGVTSPTGTAGLSPDVGPVFALGWAATRGRHGHL
jgi:hypothetical protein